MTMKAPSDRARPLIQRIAVILAVIVQIGATFLPQLGFGEPIGERSDALRTAITPVGWAFAIWGPLFLGSAVFAVWQALPAQRDNTLLSRVAWPGAVALAAQGVWAIYTQFANLTAVSVLIILVSLGGLLAVLRELARAPGFSTRERWFGAPVFSALAGWLTAASIVNVAAAFAFYGVGGDYAYPSIAAATIAIGGGIAAVATWRTGGAPWFALVFSWALLGIYQRGGQEVQSIAWACMGAAAVVLCALAVRLTDRRCRHHWLGL